MSALTAIQKHALPVDDIRLGRVPGVEGWSKFAYRQGLTAAGGEEIVWASSNTFTPMTTASTFTITYNNTTDGQGTTGALTLVFYYIDANGLPAIGIHTLGSDGSDVTSFTGLGINRMAVSSSGTADRNTNTITVTETTGGTTQAVIPALGSVTQQAIFFNGASHISIIKQILVNVISASKAPTVVVKGLVYNRTVDTIFEIFRASMDTAANLTFQYTDPVGFTLNTTDVLYFVANSSADNVDIEMRFSLTQYEI